MWAAIYPGQGSQHLGMGKFLWDHFSLAKNCFEEASDAIQLDFKRLCFDSSEADLALTHNTQPALLLVSTATQRVLRSLVSFRPLAGAGHSIGEYAALVAADTLDFSAAIKAVRKRGEWMQSAVPVGEGTMLAVMGLTASQVIELCIWAKEKSGMKECLDPANFNCPGQIVVSGNKAIIEWLRENYSPEALSGEKPQRVKFIPLKVSAPFHSSLMKPAEIEMRNYLAEVPFSDSSHPIVQNFSAEPISHAAQLRENIIRQISAPVRWVECVEKLQQMGAQHFVELGCGKVLSGLVKKIGGENIHTHQLNSLDELKNLEKALQV